MKELVMIKLWIAPEMKVVLEILYPFGGQIRLILVNWGEIKFGGTPAPKLDLTLLHAYMYSDMQV